MRDISKLMVFFVYALFISFAYVFFKITLISLFKMTPLYFSIVIIHLLTFQSFSILGVYFAIFTPFLHYKAMTTEPGYPEKVTFKQNSDLKNNEIEGLSRYMKQLLSYRKKGYFALMHNGSGFKEVCIMLLAIFRTLLQLLKQTSRMRLITHFISGLYSDNRFFNLFKIIKTKSSITRQ